MENSFKTIITPPSAPPPKIEVDPS
jgi:hypothetical protein